MLCSRTGAGPGTDYPLPDRFPSPPFRAVRAPRVHVEIDILDAGLRSHVAVARLPCSIDDFGGADLGDKKALPVATDGAAAAASFELPG